MQKYFQVSVLIIRNKKIFYGKPLLPYVKYQSALSMLLLFIFSFCSVLFRNDHLLSLFVWVTISLDCALIRFDKEQLSPDRIITIMCYVLFMPSVMYSFLSCAPYSVIPCFHFPLFLYILSMRCFHVLALPSLARTSSQYCVMYSVMYSFLSSAPYSVIRCFHYALILYVLSIRRFHVLALPSLQIVTLVNNVPISWVISSYIKLFFRYFPSLLL